MRKKEFTAGPWKTHNLDLANRKIHQIVGPITIKKEVSIYDANLISAAPELLEACEDSCGRCQYSNNIEHCDNLHCLVRAAIAKAYGETK
jgi:hypothetical protein